MILDGYDSFIDNILKKLGELGIDVSELDMDHIGYQASSDEDYEKLKPEFEKIGENISEKIIGGRRVGIYKLHQPLKYQQYTNPAIELIAPKTGQICPSSMEHVEFVINESFNSFMKKYSQIQWDLSSLKQPGFPMIKLRVDKNIQVKFHLMPLLEIIEKENE